MIATLIRRWGEGCNIVRGDQRIQAWNKNVSFKGVSRVVLSLIGSLIHGIRPQPFHV